MGTDSSADEQLENVIEIQSAVVGVKEAVMACLCGTESRRWTIGELVERLKFLGVKASRTSITGALADLEVELQVATWAPWRLIERGQEWMLVPRNELLELLLGTRGLAPDKQYSDSHKAVLLVVIGHRRKGGVSKTRIGDILGFDASTYLEELSADKLIYADPARERDFWRPSHSALLTLGFRSFTDVPALKELEDWFETLERRKTRPPDAVLEQNKNLKARRLKRELDRRRSVEPSGNGFNAEERRSELVRSQATPLPCSAGQSVESVVEGDPAQGSALGTRKQEA
jgi:hypothetical protein